MFAMRGRRYVLLAVVLAAVTTFMLMQEGARARARQYVHNMMEKTGTGSKGSAGPAPPRYLPEPTWTPPPIRDPFPAMSKAGTQAPAIPEWNKPKKDAHKQYGLDYAPPLLIGFTRGWPVLLQAVVSYITAGWPPEQIWVIDNTGGAARANAAGRLTLQNPFFLNHDMLKRLGVRVVAAPVLMNFAQLQNYYTHLAHEHKWPFYFWSHMDVLVLSLEDGLEGVTPPASEPGYRNVYELCLLELQRARNGTTRWSNVFFSYDHLSLVNREAYDDVGGWDSYIPFYTNDCDMHSRLMMRNWTQLDARSSIVTDVSTVLDDLSALYRNSSAEPAFTDPNPPPPPSPLPSSPNKGVANGEDSSRDEAKKREQEASRGAEGSATAKVRRGAAARGFDSDAAAYYDKLKRVADSMFHYKHGDRGRNTWQLGQQGGQGEPFYYAARGLAEAADVLTEAGREIFRRKWGHRDCDLIGGTKLRFEDQWRVAKDYE
ncbi:hypothetical protein HIM_01176 [Hirsutella minnesotensis 3608]|nr:hypothetical protein HIM_01176 [Hirsutella minnesotensis 3608]